MKLRNLLLGMMACASMYACSNEKENNGTTAGNGEDAAYMSFNIAMIGGDATKAGATAGGEVDGVAAESGISDVAILFFNGDALLQVVKKEEIAGLNGGVANFSNPVVALKNPSVVPSSVVVIVNPSSISFPSSLSALKNGRDYDMSITADNKFAMSNSTFFNTDNTVRMEVPISSADFATTQDAAKAKPVTIYVERAVAKIATVVKENLPITIPEGTTIDGQDKTVTVEVVGWNLSGTNKTSFMLKKLQEGWSNQAWMKGTNRSFWAEDTNYAASSTTTNDLNFNKFPTEKSASIYCLENTVDIATNNPNAATQLIVGAQIKVDGTAVNLYDYLGAKYTEGSVKNLMSNNANISKYYVEDNSGATIGGKKYVSFKPSFIELSAKGSSSYTVKATLTAEAAAKTFYTLNAEKTVATPVAKAEVETALANLGDVNKYNEGRCYYYVPIKHFGEQMAEVGVVRNHVYNVNINSISGFGTAVPNPDDIIIPEKPTELDYYVAAKVEVLKWKVVSQDVDLK